MLKFLVLTIFVGVCLCKPNSKPIAKWKRELTKGPYKMTIEEHAERVGEQQILMKSEDPKLEEAKIYRSHSFHDFETGVLAIKYIPYSAKYDEGSVCLLGEVASDFKTTMKELESRNRKTIRSCDDSKHFKVMEPAVRTNSNFVKEFCQGSPMFAMKSTRLSGIVQRFPSFKPWQIRTLCIWIDINIWFPNNMDVEGFFNPVYPIKGINKDLYTCNRF